MAIATFRRYEKKYLLTLTQYQTLLPSLEKHMGASIATVKTVRIMRYTVYIMIRNIMT